MVVRLPVIGGEDISFAELAVFPIVSQTVARWAMWVNDASMQRLEKRCDSMGQSKAFNHGDLSPTNRSCITACREPNKVTVAPITNDSVVCLSAHQPSSIAINLEVLYSLPVF